MRYIIFLLPILFLFSCGGEKVVDHKLCDCIEAGKDVDELSASFFHRETTKEGADSLNALIKERDLICEEFMEMDAMELQEKALDCEALKIDTEEK